MDKRSEKDIFWEVVRNPTLKRVLMNQPATADDDPGFYKTCKKFVDYQREACKDNGLKFDREGFMVGNPWHGNFAKAKFLFLGPNPGFTPRCLFPRWHPAEPPEREFSLGGLDAGKTLSFERSWGNANKTEDNFIGKDKVFNFLVNRFQDTCVAKSGKFSLRAGVVENGSIKPKAGVVTFWGNALDIVGELLGNNDAPSEDRTRSLMSNVLCMDIVPFGSENISTLDGQSLKYCWEHFTLPLLEKCGARAFFLIGPDVSNCFSDFLCDEEKSKAKKCFDSEKPYEYSCGDVTRWVVQLPHPGKYLEPGETKGSAVVAQRAPLLNALKSGLGL